MEPPTLEGSWEWCLGSLWFRWFSKCFVDFLCSPQLPQIPWKFK